ncbi:minor capsid protein [Streptomyces sp. NPDC058534]|uniref:minor capsid protein n=1 Tax=Streptomyces sp. NPDC058534 TaxID=3346541 RepID=UPI0036677EFB
MADLLDGLAQHLAGKGLVTYAPDAVGGDCFIDGMPSTPSEAVALTSYDDAVEPDSLLGYDEPRVQVRVRGTRDPRVSRQRCKSIRNELIGLGPVALPDGTELILAVPLGSGPSSIGADENGWHEHVANFRMEIRNVSPHRV